MQPEQIGDVVNVVFYGGLLGLIYWRVRRNIHPSRSVLWSYLGTVGIVAAMFFATAVGMLILSKVSPSYPHPLGRVFNVVELGALFGAMLIGWRVSRWWIRRPRAA
jgi:hypothetical protein